MEKVSIASKEWETPSAVLAGGFVFLSGTTSKTPSGQYLFPGDIAAQTHEIIRRIESNLRACGSSLEDIVKVTAFLYDIGSWSVFNKTYLEHFRSNRPARTTVQVGGFEEGACIEMDVIAIVPNKNK